MIFKSISKDKQHNCTANHVGVSKSALFFRREKCLIDDIIIQQKKIEEEQCEINIQLPRN